MAMWEVDDIVGIAEIAEDLGVTRQAVSNWAAGRSRPSRPFPAPLKQLRHTALLTQRRAEVVQSQQDNGLDTKPKLHNPTTEH
jgi:transcriptional regulator with XRE-family HTH domain